MTYLERELSRIRAAMPEASPERRRELYVALQALSWAGDPSYFRPPYEMIIHPFPEPRFSCRPHPESCTCRGGSR
ncbi:hypothetical protein LMIY3S_05444 [Labrys miyagiensis]